MPEDLKVALAERKDMACLWDFYSDVVECSRGTDADPTWIMGVHPSECELEEAIEAGVLLICRTLDDDERIAAAAVVDHMTAGGYDDVAWPTEVSREQAAVVHLFAVHPDFRGRGLARRFMNDIADFARDRGDKVIRLDTLESNKGACATYRRLGFTDCGFANLSYDNTDVTDFVMFELVL